MTDGSPAPVPKATAATFLDAGTELVRLLGTIPGDRWGAPSALTGYTIGGLAAHSARALSTPVRYLDAGPVDPDARSVDAPAYLVGILGDADPVDSELHRAVRSRADAAAAAGPDAVVRAAVDALDRLHALLPSLPPEHPVAVLDGIVMPLAEYLRTRIVEIVVHADDLQASVPELDVRLSTAAWDETVAVLAAAASLRHGARAVVRSLARAERRPEPVRAL